MTVEELPKNGIHYSKGSFTSQRGADVADCDSLYVVDGTHGTHCAEQKNTPYRPSFSFLIYVQTVNSSSRYLKKLSLHSVQ